MKKSTNKTEGYFSFNTPTGNRIAKGDTEKASAQPTFNDFVCMPESEQQKKRIDDTDKSDINYF
ncbi:MAG: hypothetical protein ACI35Q_10110 [Marinilabiliaceae bacterium]